MPTRGLKRICEDFRKDSNRLAKRFCSPLPTSPPYDRTCPAIHTDAQALLVLYLQTAWAEYCRALVLYSLMGATTSAGRRLVSPLQRSSLPDAQARLTAVAKSVAEAMGVTGQVWHSHEFVIRMVEGLGIQNQNEIALPLEADVVVGHLNGVRNYVAHPNGDALRRFDRVASAYGLPGADIGTFLNHAPQGSPLFVAWIQQLQQLASRVSI